MPPLFDGETGGRGKVGQEEAVVNIVDVEDAFHATLSLSVSVQKGDAVGVVGSTVGADVTEIFHVCYRCRWKCVYK